MRATRGIGDVNEILLEVIGLAIENEMAVVEPGEAAIFAAWRRATGRAGEFERVDLSGDVFRDAIDDFDAGVGRGFVVMNDLRAAV